MPGKGSSRKLYLAMASFSVLMVAVLIPGCGTAPAADSPVTDISFNPDRNVLYIGAMTKVMTPKGGGGFCIYELDKERFTTKNESNGFWGPNVNYVQYDSVSQQVFMLHTNVRYSSMGGMSKLMSLYDPSSGSVNNLSAMALKMTLAGDKLFYNGGSNYIYMSNRTGNLVSFPGVQIYPPANVSGATGITAMLWASDSLFFSTSNPPLLMCWKDGMVRNITGQKCNCLVQGPQLNIYFGTDTGLQYYDITVGQVYNTSCTGQIIDLVTNYRDSLVYALVHEPLGTSIKAHQVIGDTTGVLIDSDKCSILAYSPTCIEFAVNRNQLYAGTAHGMMIYNVLSNKFHTKTFKDGMPTEPSHAVAPGFEVMAAVAVVATVVGIRKYRTKYCG